MCGILSQVDFVDKINKDHFYEALKLIKHRGPDVENVLELEHGLFGHQRLSILDLSRNADQPMQSNDGRYTIIYNGEIYNFKILREILSQDVKSWNSNSDTEVVLKSYEKWGVDCLNKLEGMFAFIIWDNIEKIFGARDRMGVKPFYYYEKSKSLTIASRPSPIIKLNQV